MSDDPHYIAHARRMDLLRRAWPEPLASYYHGYRIGMATGDNPAGSGLLASALAALAGQLETDDLDRFARACGFADGREWGDVTRHRGLLRLAIAVAGESNAGFAARVLGISDASLRQMLAGTRPIPATRHQEILDVIVGSSDDLTAEFGDHS